MSQFKQVKMKIRKEGWNLFPRLFNSVRDTILEVHESNHHPKCICIDMGSQQIKYLLVQGNKTNIQILRHGVIDLKEDALLSTEEVDTQLGKIIRELGEYPIALAAPQNLVTSQTIDVPEKIDEDSPEEIREYLRSVTTPGATTTSFLIGYKKLSTSGTQLKNPYYASIAKEQGITELIGRFVKTSTPLFYVHPALNAIATGFLKEDINHPSTTVIIDIGAICTHALIIYENQPILGANFPIGGEYLTEHLSKALRCTFDEAEVLKRQNNYLIGPHVNAIFQTAVRRWLKDLIAWFMELGRSTASIRGVEFTEESFLEETSHLHIYLCGGATNTPGLIEYLCSKSAIKFQTWPQYSSIPDEISCQRFAACIGTALEALRIVPTTGNLTPRNLISAYRINRLRFHTLTTSLAILILLLVVFCVASVSVFLSTTENKNKLKETESTIQSAQTIISEYQKRDKELLSFSPILRMHKRTLDALNILKAQQDMVIADSNSIWFLLLADKHTYVHGKPSIDNYTNQTIQMGDSEDILAGKFSYITELCIVTNHSDNQQRLFFSSVRDKLTNLFFIDYADTLLSNLFSTNNVDQKYFVGGDRFGSIFTTRSLFNDNFKNQATNATILPPKPIVTE